MRLAPLLVLVLVLVACTGCAQAPLTRSNTQPWPAGDKQVLVDACQAQIWQRAENAYRNAHGALPQNFRQTVAAGLQPQLEACRCYVDRLEAEWSYDELASRRAQLDAKLKEITASGTCRR
jgi:hypothetical protein